MMREDSENRTRWKHEWRWHNRGNVWDKMATCWAGKEEWLMARKEQTSPEDKYKFITFILNKMKLPTEHRISKNNDKDTTRDLGPEDVAVSHA